jgi:hypothetical protein
MWIDVKNLTVFDSAHCNEKSRKTLLDLFSKQYFVLKQSIRLEQCHRWLASRQLHTCKIHFASPKEEKKYFDNITLSKIQEITFASNQTGELQYYTGQLTEIINNCSSLTSLNIDENEPPYEWMGNADYYFQKIQTTILSQLQAIFYHT